MSAYTVIAGVTKTLAGVLFDATGVAVEYDKSPDDNFQTDQPLIHLYLYRVEPNPFFTNNDWIRGSPTTLVEPPIGLNLFYLITPYGKGQSQVQMTLGEIIKVFHESPIVSPSAFDPTLVGTTEELRIVYHPLTLETMTELWRSFEKRSYRLSLAYEASVVLIDSEIVRNVVPVAERHIRMKQVR